MKRCIGDLQASCDIYQLCKRRPNTVRKFLLAVRCLTQSLEIKYSTIFIRVQLHDMLLYEF